MCFCDGRSGTLTDPPLPVTRPVLHTGVSGRSNSEYRDITSQAIGTAQLIACFLHFSLTNIYLISSSRLLTDQPSACLLV
jgi:hypothetical protein